MKTRHYELIGLLVIGVSIATGVFAQPACAPYSSSIIHWYRAESNTWDYVNPPQFNGGWIGQWIGPESYNHGEVGTAFNLTGTNYVEITNTVNQVSNAMTIELWMSNAITGNNGDWTALVSKGNGAWRFMCTTRADTVYVAFDGLSPNFDLFGTKDVNDGKWHHVAATYDGSTISIYVDGVLDTSTNATGTIVGNDQPIDIGSDSQPPPGHNYTFTGELDEVSIYNRALTSCEIQEIYSAGPSGKCLGAYPN